MKTIPELQATDYWLLTPQDRGRLHKHNAEAFLRFWGNYGHALPEEVNVVITELRASLGFTASEKDETARNQLLSAISETFGPDGWFAEANYRNTFFDWSKEVDGVRLVITNAKPIVVQTKISVDPKEFPILLA